jgi:hypothetical protein
VDVPEMSVTAVFDGNRRGGYPAVDPLAPPAGPLPGEVGAVVATANPLIADAFALERWLGVERPLRSSPTRSSVSVCPSNVSRF